VPWHTRDGWLDRQRFRRRRQLALLLHREQEHRECFLDAWISIDCRDGASVGKPHRAEVVSDRKRRYGASVDGSLDGHPIGGAKRDVVDWRRKPRSKDRYD
jgi:hypothetical protein